MQLVKALLLIDNKHMGFYQHGDVSYLGFLDANCDEQSLDIADCSPSGMQLTYTLVEAGTFVTVCDQTLDLSELGACGEAYSPSAIEVALPQDVTPVKSLCLIGDKHIEIGRWSSKSYVGYTDICDGLMILLLISAVGAGFVSWKKFNHPAAGLVAAVIPLILGIQFYVFVGIISAIAEIAMLSYLGREAQISAQSVESEAEQEQ